MVTIKREEIKLSADELDILSKKLERMVSRAVSYRAGFSDMRRENWSMWLARPDDLGSDWPWPGASRFFSPMGRVAVDTTLSLISDTIFQNKPRVAGIEGTDSPRAEKMTRFFFDYIFKKQVNLPLLGNDFTSGVLIDGTQVMEPHWERLLVGIREEEVTSEPVSRTETGEVYGQQVEVSYLTGEMNTTVTEKARAVRTDRLRVDIPDMERVFVAPGTQSSVSSASSLQSETCEYYYVETPVPYEQVRRMAFDGFKLSKDQEAVPNRSDEPKKFQRDASKLASELEEILKKLTGEVELTDRERDEHDSGRITTTGMHGALLRTFYCRLVLPGTYITEDGSERSQKFDDISGISEEVIVWQWAKTGAVARIVPLSRLRPDNKRPGIDSRYDRVGRFFYGMGIPSKVRQAVRLDTSATRQMMDYGTLQNKPWMLYEPASMGILPAITSLAPGSAIPVRNAGRTTMPRFQGNHQFWQVLRQVALQWSERLSNVNDFTIGRNPSSPNSPRTFRGQASMLQQGQIAFSNKVNQMVQAWEELFYRSLVLVQRNMPESIEFSYFNSATGMIVRDYVTREDLAGEVNFIIELNPNRAFEEQKAANRLSMLLNIPYIIQDPEMTRSLIGDVYAADGESEKFEKLWPREKLQIQSGAQAAPQIQQAVSQLPSNVGIPGTPFGNNEVGAEDLLGDVSVVM